MFKTCVNMKLEPYRFYKVNFKFLSLFFKRGGVNIYPNNVGAVQNWPVSQNIFDIQLFIYLKHFNMRNDVVVVAIDIFHLI